MALFQSQDYVVNARFSSICCSRVLILWFLREVVSHSDFHILSYNEDPLAFRDFVAVKSIMTSVALTMYYICEKKIEKLLPDG